MEYMIRQMIGLVMEILIFYLFVLIIECTIEALYKCWHNLCLVKQIEMTHIESTFLVIVFI